MTTTRIGNLVIHKGQSLYPVNGVFANEVGHVCRLPFDQADPRRLAHCTTHPKWSVVKHDFDNMWAVYTPYAINPTAERFTWAEAFRLAQEKAK